MAASATSADVAAIKALLEVFRLEIDSTVAANKSLWLAQATLALDRWEDAENAVNRINAETATSYSSGVGGSFQKKRLDDQKAAAAAALAEFRQLCNLGGVDLPLLSDGYSVWRMDLTSWVS